MPSELVATPSVSMQPPSNRRSSLAPDVSTLESPVGAGNPGSSACASTIAPSVSSIDRPSLWPVDLSPAGHDVAASQSLAEIIVTSPPRGFFKEIRSGRRGAPDLSPALDILELTRGPAEKR